MRIKASLQLECNISNVSKEIRQQNEIIVDVKMQPKLISDNVSKLNPDRLAKPRRPGAVSSMLGQICFESISGGN